MGMKCVVLAAGYATRLYPLTKDWPKALLDVAGKPMIEHIMAKVELCESIDDVLVMAGDNLFDFDLRDFVRFYKSVGRDCITVHALDDVASLQWTGVAEVDEDGRVS